MKNVFVFLSLVVLIRASLPPNFTKCNRKQPDFKECVFKASIHGIKQLTRPYPEVNLPNVSPFFLTEASISAGTGRVAVDQKFKDINVYGLTQIELEKFEFDLDNKKIYIKGTFPEVKIDCKYETKGQVLLFPVNGKGNSTIVLKNLKVDSSFDYEETRKKSKTHLKIVASQVDLNPELVTFDFQNIGGDKRLTSNINQVLNDNWKEVFDDVKGGYIEIINQILLSLFNNFFAKVSMEEAFDS